MDAIAIPGPDILVHADWGSDPRKRWMCIAAWIEGRYLVHAPEPVGELAAFWARTLRRARGGSVVVGFDFPIGLPVAYAERTGITNFKQALMEFGRGDWGDFYRLAERPEQISRHRPFYPYRPGGTRQSDLMQGLGVGSMHDLLRRCEQPTATRGAASPLFWTLGGKQVGRAAIIGWRDLLAPGLADPNLDLRLWPFDGTIGELAQPGRVVVAETYPAEACVHLGLSPPGNGWSKTSQTGRQAQSSSLLAWAARRGVVLEEPLRHMIADGFGPQNAAEDPFDAVLGAMSMVEVCGGHREEGAPSEEAVRRIEGWILGQRVD
jgi:hypothetical protein